MKKIALLASALLLTQLCSLASASESTTASLKAITSAGLLNHIKVLASDDFEGRKPFTAGETKTINYLKGEFEKLGLKPGNGDSYFQEVPTVLRQPQLRLRLSRAVTV